jgi:hypothetical protein
MKKEGIAASSPKRSWSCNVLSNYANYIRHAWIQGPYVSTNSKRISHHMTSYSMRDTSYRRLEDPSHKPTLRYVRHIAN